MWSGTPSNWMRGRRGMESEYHKKQLTLTPLMMVLCVRKAQGSADLVRIATITGTRRMRADGCLPGAAVTRRVLVKHAPNVMPQRIGRERSGGRLVAALVRVDDTSAMPP